MQGVGSHDVQRPRPMAWDAYHSSASPPLTDSLELFERVLRRSFAAGVEREYISYPPAQPVAGQYEDAIFHLVLRTTGLVGGTPTVKIVIEDSSDGNNWAALITYTEAGPSDGTYRYQAPTPFGNFLRVRLLISGSGGIGLVLCRGVLSVKRQDQERQPGSNLYPMDDTGGVATAMNRLEFSENIAHTACACQDPQGAS